MVAGEIGPFTTVAAIWEALVNEKLEASKTPASFPNDPTIPDIYADGITVKVGTTGIGLIFTKTMHDPITSEPVVVVRLSPHQAYLATQVMRKALRVYQEANGPIIFAEGLLEGLELDKEL